MTTITITDQSTINAIQAAYNSGDWQTAYNLVSDMRRSGRVMNRLSRGFLSGHRHIG
jgi:hypothetical protein